MGLEGTKTHENLKAAFAGESQANRRYLYFARQADIEGYPEAAGVFKNTADGETGHAFGHLEFLSEVGDPATGKPIGSTDINLEAAVAGEHMSIQKCILVLLQQHVKKAMMKLQNGLKHLLELKNLMRVNFSKHSILYKSVD